MLTSLGTPFNEQSSSPWSDGTHLSVQGGPLSADISRYQDLSAELRTLLFTATRECTPEPSFGDSSTVPTVSPQPSNRANQLTTWDRQRHRHDRYAHNVTHLTRGTQLLDEMQLSLHIRRWIKECAPWLDMFDRTQTFGVQVPCLAKNSPPVFFSMLALSARQSERSSGATRSLKSIELYSEAIAAMSAAFDPSDACILLSACILCVLEMMSASPQEWSRHLEGCAALFSAAGIHGISGGLPQAVFWCYARMDLCSAIMSDGVASTVFPLAEWFPVSALRSICDEESIMAAIRTKHPNSPDMHANYMVFLAAQVCDLQARYTRYSEGRVDIVPPSDEEYQIVIAWQSLWEDLQSWFQSRPAGMLPIKIVVDSQPFPRAFYGHFAAISSNQLYHTACILMLELQQDMHREETVVSGKRTIVWHARHVVGISLANPHKGCMNNAIQPLFIAGRRFTHRAEQLIVVGLLEAIEANSGWAARWRIPDLETAWGYPHGTFSHRVNATSAGTA